MVLDQEYRPEERKPWRIWLSSDQRKRYIKAKNTYGAMSITHPEFMELLLLIDQGRMDALYARYKPTQPIYQYQALNSHVEKSDASRIRINSLLNPTDQ
jgi:hypothetical protein